MKIVPTVHQLRQKKFKVTVNHYRNFFKYCTRTGKRSTVQISWLHRSVEFDDYFLDPCGGRTEISILDVQGNQHVGVAVCSDGDLYCRKTGVKKALAQAYGNYLVDKQ